jgi:hypothetical protein
MRTIILAVIGMAAAAPAFAQCVGTNTFKTCMDDQGNSVTVSRLGNSTIVNGSNAQTGSTWSQQTMRGPSMSTTTGMDSNGRNWSATSSAAGTSGIDADGNAFWAPPPPRR